MHITFPHVIEAVIIAATVLVAFELAGKRILNDYRFWKRVNAVIAEPSGSCSPRQIVPTAPSVVMPAREKLPVVKRAACTMLNRRNQPKVRYWTLERGESIA